MDARAGGSPLRLPAGQSLAIIGPSAAGKSTLCKLLLSIWAPTAGKVRIDRADIHSWDSEKLGPYIGYLPQDVELFAGSVAENIARMGDVDSQKVIAAAQMAGVHSMVLGLPKGYDTQIGEHGAALSGGQRQRIGLARALYGDPRLVVLDEPNSNLDEEGEQQLARAVLTLKQRNATVVLVTHKPSILNIVDNIIVMQEGQIALSGPRQAVLEKLAAMRHQQEQAVVHSRHHKIRFQKQHNNAAHRWDEHRQHPIPPGKRETERLACDKHHGRGNEQPRGKRIDHEECRLFRKISIRVDRRKKHQKRAAVYEVD